MWLRILTQLLLMKSILCNLKDGEHICKEEKRFTVNVTRQVEREETIRKYVWCMNVPPRCPTYTTRKTLVPETAEEERVHLVNVCCPGFFEREEKCVTECEIACKNGYCNENHECVCTAGFYGENCSLDCSSTYSHQHCASSCPCNQGECQEGKCQCLPGWRGERCDYICPNGLLGPNCDIDPEKDLVSFETPQPDFTTEFAVTDATRELKNQLINTNDTVLITTVSATYEDTYDTKHTTGASTKITPDFTHHSAEVANFETTILVETSSNSTLPKPTESSPTFHTTIKTTHKLFTIISTIPTEVPKQISSSTTSEEIGEMRKRDEGIGLEDRMGVGSIAEGLLLGAGMASVAVVVAAFVAVIIYRCKKTFGQRRTGDAEEMRSEGEKRAPSIGVQEYANTYSNSNKFPTTACEHENGLPTLVLCNAPHLHIDNMNDIYDHPPSTGSYRAVALPEPPNFEMKTFKADLLTCEPVYDEIPNSGRQPVPFSHPPSYNSDESSSSVYINIPNKRI